VIHEIGVELEAALKAKGCSMFPVADGPEATATTTFARSRIVIAHDEGGDAFSPVRSQSSGKAKHRFTRAIGCKITIYAQDPRAGARPFEHRRRAERVLDLVLVALAGIAATRKNALSVKGGRFVQPDDLAKSEEIGGAVYELLFTFDRAVIDRTWAGAERAEATLASGSITSTTKVSLKGGADDDDDPTTVPATAETACGA
jgi:hypothetical protein